MRSITMPVHTAAASLLGLVGLVAVLFAAVTHSNQIAWPGVTAVVIASVIYLRGALLCHVERVIADELAALDVGVRLAGGDGLSTAPRPRSVPFNGHPHPSQRP